MKIEYKTTEYSEEKIVYWVTHSDVYDSELNKTDIKIFHDNQLGNFIRIPAHLNKILNTIYRFLYLTQLSVIILLKQKQYAYKIKRK